MNNSSLFKRVFFGSSTKVIHLILAAVSSFFLMPFLVKTLGTEQYGIWILASAFAGYYGFFDFGIATAVGRFMASAFGKGDPQRINILSSSALATYLVISLIIILITIGVVLFVDKWIETPNDIFSSLILILGLGLALQFPAKSFGTILVGSLRHDILNSVEIFILVFRTGLIFLLIGDGYGVITLALISSIATIFTCAVNYFFVRKVFPEYDIRLSFVQWNTIKELLHYAKTMFVFTVSYQVKVRTLPFIVSGIVGAKMLVIYNIASTFIVYFKEAVTAVTGMSYHITSRFEGNNNLAAIQQVLKLSVSVSTLVATYIATSLIIYGNPFISVWMGEEFILSHTLLNILCVEAFVFMMDPCLNAFAGLSKHKINATLNALDTTLSIILATALGYAFGIVGIVIGATIPLLIKIVAIPIYTVKVLKVSFREIFVENMLLLFTVTSFSIWGYYELMVQLFHLPETYFDLIIFNILQGIVVAPIAYMFLPQELKQVINQKILVRSRNLLAWRSAQ